MGDKKVQQQLNSINLYCVDYKIFNRYAKFIFSTTYQQTKNGGIKCEPCAYLCTEIPSKGIKEILFNM